MVEIMRFIGGNEGKMIARVSDQSITSRKTHPEPNCRQMRSHQNRTSDDRSHIAHDVFNWMAIDGNYSKRCLPLMMDLVN